MEIVDAQVHINLLGPIEVGVAAMDAAGIDVALVDELEYYLPNGRRLPSVELSNGAYRILCPRTDEAIARYPGRFGAIGRIDFRDPELDWMFSQLRTPDRPCVRLSLLVSTGEKALWESGGLMEYFRTARKYDVPVMVRARGATPALVQYAEALPDLQFVIDHCGIVNPGPEIKGEARFAGLYETIKMAKYPNIALKWGHAPTMSEQPYPFRDLWPHFMRVVEAFGPERILYTSDYTQSRHKATWSQSYFYILDSSELSEGDKEWILGKALRTVLRWPRTVERAPLKSFATTGR